MGQTAINWDVKKGCRCSSWRGCIHVIAEGSAYLACVLWVTVNLLNSAFFAWHFMFHECLLAVIRKDVCASRVNHGQVSKDVYFNYIIFMSTTDEGTLTSSILFLFGSARIWCKETRSALFQEAKYCVMSAVLILLECIRLRRKQLLWLNLSMLSFWRQERVNSNSEGVDSDFVYLLSGEKMGFPQWSLPMGNKRAFW